MHTTYCYTTILIFGVNKGKTSEDEIIKKLTLETKFNLSTGRYEVVRKKKYFISDFWTMANKFRGVVRFFSGFLSIINIKM